jgi:hypothetical protein
MYLLYSKERGDSSLPLIYALLILNKISQISKKQKINLFINWDLVNGHYTKDSKEVINVLSTLIEIGVSI